MGLTRDVLVSEYVQSPLFDTHAFFFLTHRSDVAGSVIVWPRNSFLSIEHLSVTSSHRTKVTSPQGVGECLLKLAVNYALNKSATEVQIATPTSYLRSLAQTLGFQPLN